MAGTEIIAVLLVLLLAYLYLGYPIMLWLFSALFPRANRFDLRHRPTVTLVISAYNEAEVIAGKLENSLALDYPAEKLEIVVVSDCSSDGTDDRVLSFADRGVRLVRAGERRGKTSALNAALETIDSEIVVFSDANAIYDRQAIRYLVGHFVDEEVGYVVGHARYQEESPTAAGGSEGVYWDLEVKIKECESRLSSVVGGDGAIYALRRSLYEPMLESDINDFVNPLQIVAKGQRGVFDRRAWCVERPAGEFNKEFSRKVRIANRSFNAVLRVREALNPFRVGVFAWQLWSHKVLRWFSPFFLAALLLVVFADLLAGPVRPIEQLLSALCCTVLALAFAGWLGRNRKGHPLISLPYYFVLMNAASAKGILLRLRGTTISTWSTVREKRRLALCPPALRPALAAYPGLFFLAVLLFGELASPQLLTAATWLMAGLLAHAYLGYPCLLPLLGAAAGKTILRDEAYLPSVTLLIVAYNEEREIEQKLRNSLQLDYPRELLRIVVASDGSSDATERIVSAYAEEGVVLLAYPHNRGKMAALNDAMTQVSSELVVFSDANVAYRPSALRKLVRNFSDPRVGAVSGKVVLVNDALSYGLAENSYYGVEHSIQQREGALGALIGADGAMYAIRRALFEAPAPDTILDDLVIAMGIARKGHLVLHEEEAVGFEVNRLELAGEFRRKARIIAGGYQCLLRFSAVPGLTRPLLLFCFLSHKVLRWTSGLMMLALLGLLVQIHARGGEVPLVLTAMLVALLGLMSLALLTQVFPFLRGFRVPGYSNYFFMLMAASLAGCYLGVTGRQKAAWRGGNS